MLVGDGCKWRKCRFCDYHLDSSKDIEANFQLNKQVLSNVTGKFGELEVINSGSFSNTPRLMITSMVVYAIVQEFDVWAYHKWWDFTNKLVGDRERFLWLRNNGSTLISQFLNNILYTFGAFWGIHDFKTLISIAISSYVIFIVTSLADTPFVYLARRISKKIKE